MPVSDEQSQHDPNQGGHQKGENDRADKGRGIYISDVVVSQLENWIQCEQEGIEIRKKLLHRERASMRRIGKAVIVL
jgi:hypothetical protein